MPKQQSNVRERVHTGLKKPDMFRVIMHNDDFTTMEFVVEMLRVVFYKDAATAETLMLKVHHEGQAQIGIYTYDMAVSKCQKAMRMAREQGYPFKLTYEPEK